MKIIDVEQGSEAWLAWRRTVITATDCPAIMGSSPWSTAYRVWQRKLSHIDEQISNEAMERGKRLEPKARAKFIEDHNINMTPRVVESIDTDFLGASLDGLSDCHRYVLEIKCGGANLHRQASEGYIPAYYRDQIQHQLIVTGCEKAFYYSFDGENGICIEVLPDSEFKQKWMTKCREFWRCVAFNEPPPLQDSDYKDMSDIPHWKSYASEYKRLDEQIKALEEIKDSYRKELLKLCDDQNCLGQGIRVMKTLPRGRIDYDAIPELQGVDVDKYRKSSTAVWKIMVA